jgi:hypothetical protein
MLNASVFWRAPLLGTPIISNLDDAAKCIECIPRLLLVRDPTLALWMNMAYTGRANGIRALRKWILVPKVDTPHFLDKEVRRIIEQVAAGDLDGLPIADRDAFIIVPWWKWGLQLLRGLAIIAIPPLAVVAVNVWMPRGWMKPEMNVYLVLIAVLWTLINVLYVVDPKLADKLALMKRAQELFTGTSK